MGDLSRGAGPLSNRRGVIAGAAVLALWPRAAAARRGFAIDWQGAAPDPAVAAFLEGQVRLVEALPVSGAAMDFFRGQVIHVDRERGTRTRAVPAIHFARVVQPADNPVLLHELVHRWQVERMRGPRDPRVVALWEAAKASGDWPAQSYMLSNPFEFFAMCASVVLYGRAARPPFTRVAVKATLPAVYALVVEEFGARGLA
ncbi:hypothetical protein [Sphingomonas sp.]|uniref:hypothetical protein n=1 Tax=Sphingomonas sp. TaxID=28214 RepID=UPI002DD6ADFA|nr:hypothetical protein [Sphingomonas sp.]